MSNSRLETIIKDSHRNKCSMLKIRLISGDEYIIFTRQVRLIDDYVTLNYKQIKNIDSADGALGGCYDGYYATSGKTQFRNVVGSIEAASREYNIDKLEIFKEFVEYAYTNDKLFWKELDKTIVESLDNNILSMTNVYNERLENTGTVYIDDGTIASVTCIDNRHNNLIYAEYSNIIDLVNEQKIA